MEQTNITEPNIAALTIFKSSANSLNFRELKHDDIEIIRTFFTDARSHLCDYTIGGLYMWIDYYHYTIAIEHNTLFISEQQPSGERVYWLPIGAMSHEQSICRLLEHCESLGEELILFPAQQYIVRELSRSFELGSVEVVEGRSDYIHRAAEFALFAGRKYSKKRNHAKRFLRENPNYTVEELGVQHIESLIAFHTSINSESDQSELRLYEGSEVVKSLRNYTLYGYEGVVLMSEGMICGFCYGTVVGDMLFVHAEKCDKSLTGCTQVLASEYVKRMLTHYPTLKWLNREDDMNIPNIRRAKESYHPDYMLHKSKIKVVGVL